VKNLMDTVELESMPTLLRVGLQQLAELIEAGQQEGAVSAYRTLVSC
jgi:O2-independent ubiquinone biosynthesis accessory factor UbiT